jgi:hypothetical protein
MNEHPLQTTEISHHKMDFRKTLRGKKDFAWLLFSS